MDYNGMWPFLLKMKAANQRQDGGTFFLWVSSTLWLLILVLLYELRMISYAYEWVNIIIALICCWDEYEEREKKTLISWIKIRP